MLTSITGCLQRLSLRTTISGSLAGPSRPALTHFARSTAMPSTTLIAQHPFGCRNAQQLAPKRVKYKKAHKGRVGLRTGGSVKGTTLTIGSYGVRVLQPCRITAKTLSSIVATLKQKTKSIRGCRVYLRVFPHIPVCVSGNEKRMGKGKGSFDHWMCRASAGRVIVEIGGPIAIRAEVAKEALRLAISQLPSTCEIIDRNSPARLGKSVTTPPTGRIFPITQSASS